MNNQQIKRQLTNDLPECDVQSHKDALRKFLISHYEPRIHEKNSLWKGGDYIMKHKILSLGATGFFVIALIVGWTVFGDSPFSPLPPAQAEAKEILDRTYDKVFKLSPEEQQELKVKLNADLESSLNEARNAKDLTVVPEEELTRIAHPPSIVEGKPAYGFKAVETMDVKNEDGTGPTWTGKAMTPGTRVQVEPGKIMAPEGLTMLRYTDPQGRTVFLGIDKDDKPVFKMIQLEKKDIDRLEKEAKVIRFNQKVD